VLRVAVKLQPLTSDGAEFLADARALEAAGADALWVEESGSDPWVVLGALAAITHRVRIGFAGARASEPRADTVQALSRGRFLVSEPVSERWIAREMPPDREAWTAMLREAEAAGAIGIVVPWNPRLIDLLRNPDPDDRSDLLMSTG
jgi:Luciferase-like monooxygenase